MESHQDKLCDIRCHTLSRIQYKRVRNTYEMLLVLRTLLGLLNEGLRLADLAVTQRCTTTGVTANSAQAPSFATFLRL